MIRLRHIIVISFVSDFIFAELPVNVDHKKNSIGIESRTTIADRTCAHKTCLQLCCPAGKALVHESCVDDNYTSEIKLENIDENDFGSFHNDPCLFGWMSFSLFDRFAAFANGSISVSGNGEESVFDFEHYCLYREPKSVNYSAKVCQPWIETIYWHSVCLVFTSVLMSVTFVIYGMVPEFKKLHGWVFRAYVATYIGGNVASLGLQFTTGLKSYANLFTLVVLSLHYSAGCCALWLNVMSFNIWRTFRGLKQIEKNVKERERKKFIRYAIYAWGFPALFYSTVFTVVTYAPHFQKYPIDQKLMPWSCAILLISVFTINIFLYASTSLKIKQYKKETVILNNGCNKHHVIEEHWLKLHVKLFIITGVHTMTWVSWELWPMTINSGIMIVLEVLLCVLTFVIFTWTENVKKYLRKRFDDTLIELINNILTIFNRRTRIT